LRAATRRPARVRASFDAQVSEERRRLAGSADRELRRTLIERFLRRNLARVSGRLLEIGPGPGRLTPVLTRLGAPVALLDLSRPMLRAARSAFRRVSLGNRPFAYVQGAAEGLRMFRDSTFGAVVIVGLFGFFARDGDLVLEGAARALRPGGTLVVETQSATGAVSEIFPRSPSGARAILRSPERFYLERIFREGYQPYDPEHFANWEYRFWRPDEIVRSLETHGFRVVDRMSIAPMLGAQPRLLAQMAQDRAAWPHALEYEERAGRRPECLGIGFGLLTSARLGTR
jgi:ubiquinone/menaquinone biosynthesis C-methylase UbiE